MTSILADKYATKKERKRFGQTTHHVDKIKLHEDFVKGQEISLAKFTKFDIGLLRVEEPFTSAVNFASLPPLLLNVEGKNTYSCQFGCGILKMVGLKMKDFCPIINVLNENFFKTILQ